MTDPDSATQDVEARIAGIGGWRGAVLGRMRALIREADPDVVETIKWRKPGNPGGVPTWEHAGILCTGEVYKATVKLTFAHGAALDDPAGLLIASVAARGGRSTSARARPSIRTPSGRS